MKSIFRVVILIKTSDNLAKIKPNEKLTKSHADLDQENRTMTCYLKHLKQIFEKAGIDITQANKKEIDKIIHKIVGMNYKNCPATWKQTKNLISKDEANFVNMLKDAWKNRSQP